MLTVTFPPVLMLVYPDHRISPHLNARVCWLSHLPRLNARVCWPSHFPLS